MKFRIDENDLYYDLVELSERGRDAEDAAKEWLERRFGKALNFGSPAGYLWGGIGAVQFKTAKKGWKQVNARERLYVPELPIDIKSIEELPKVHKDELKVLLGYGEYPTPRGINTVPSLMIGNGYALIAVPDSVRGYTAVEGMVEILGSEYNRLYDEAQEWRNS